ncbi:MAG: V-type ATP synthase subunit K [Actinobacteria bacterium]|nr:V-type ATP synthase subunit K [Actinomycetota bacterium]
MSPEAAAEVGRIGAVAAMAFSAVGSGLGSGLGGAGAVGAWKKLLGQGKMPTFTLITFVGAPLSQTIYGMILMITMLGKADAGYNPWALLGAGVAAGIGIGASAYAQGKVGAHCADALGETGQGFSNYLAVIGIVETVAIFVMVFTILALG